MLEYNAIRCSSNIQDLLGVGEEWLTDQQGNVLTIFLDGNIRQPIEGNFEVTIGAETNG